MNSTHLMIKNIIRREYSIRSDILSNMCSHVDNLNRDSIIHHTVRNKIMNEINNCVTKLNTAYNNSLPLYKKFNYKPDPTEEHFIKNHDTENYYLYISIHNNSLKCEIMIFFNNVDNDIKNIMGKIGSKYISDAFKLINGNNYEELMGIEHDVNELKQYVQNNKKNMDLQKLLVKMHNSSALIYIIQKYFNTIEIHIGKGFNKQKTTVLVKKYRYDKLIGSDESTKFKYEILLENCYKITIKCANTKKTYVSIGYFENDVVNSIVTTSQICNNYIYYKKKLLTEYAKVNTLINDSYKDTYLANMSLGDILCYKGDEIVEKMLTDYDLYMKSCHIKFKVTVNDFLKSDLTKKYSILRCLLLLGSKNTVKNAAMLFGITKDQNNDIKNNKSCVADILYRNLNYSQQCKLRKSGQYIKMELDKIKKMTLDDMDLKQQCIMNNNMNDHVKKCVFNRLDEMKSNNSEYYKNHVYVKTLIEYPWVPDDYCDIFTTIGNDIDKCRNRLKKIRDEFDKRVFGQNEFKTVICDLIGKWFTNPNSMGKVIGLCGPPGVGKTLIASGLGKVLEIPYQEIHLGGLDDGSVLNGHSFTYSGAQPGLIITKMVMAGKPRCVLFFDEVDKACAKHGINEIFNVLIHVTDTNTNDKFSDKFFQDVVFPLNKCIFVFSFNDESKIDPILKDRMEIINVSPYSQNDKITIARDYLIPELLKDIGIEKDSIIMAPLTIENIINKYTLEAGVRKLKNCIEKIFLKMNIDRIYSRGPFRNKTTFSKNNPIRINKNNVLKYLGNPTLTIEKIHSTNQVGVVNGLYATSAGSGGILPILCYLAKNRTFKITLGLTGKQGEIMRESVKFAWIIAKNCVKTNIITNFYKNNMGGIHVHTPDGAVPKDGPSAGSAFTTAFISRLTGFPVKHNIAMTGEININGEITKIGGLEYKLTGAKMAGVKLIFVSEDNFEDIKKIKESYPNLCHVINHNNNPNVQKFINNTNNKKKSNNIYPKIMIVKNIYDIVSYALVDPEYIKTYFPNGKYASYDQTCNHCDFMVKHNDGFVNEIINKDDIIDHTYPNLSDDNDGSNSIIDNCDD